MRQIPKLERLFEEPMEAIHHAAKHMDRLIQDLLDVALMEAEQLTIARARLTAGELIAEAVDMQRPLASSSSLELRVEVHADVAEVWVDKDRLLQVLGTSLATPSNSRRLAVASRWARRRGMTRSSSGSQIRGVASRLRTCPMSLTDFGKHPGPGVGAPGSGSPSRKASSRRTGDASGSRAQGGVGGLSSSRFPKSLNRCGYRKLDLMSGMKTLGELDENGRTERDRTEALIQRRAATRLGTAASRSGTPGRSESAHEP